MSSNIKGKTPGKDTEPFKRAVTGCLRAAAANASEATSKARNEIGHHRLG
jgi:cobalamin biosynthesis protein CobT